MKTKTPDGLYLVVSGGVLQDVYFSGNPNKPFSKCDIFVIDYDTDGCDNQTVIKDKYGNEERAYVYMANVWNLDNYDPDNQLGKFAAKFLEVVKEKS